jgi:methylmalonyl-CoA/ethylmalonyl-CoA epimerase
MSSLTPATTPSRLGQVAILVQDLSRAVAFYRDVLGLRFLFDAPPGLAFFDCGGVRLMLSRPEGESGGSSMLYYAVADLPATMTRLRAAGVDVLHDAQRIAQMPDHDLWMAFIRDSEGNALGLMSEVPRAADPS